MFTAKGQSVMADKGGGKICGSY